MKKWKALTMFCLSLLLLSPLSVYAESSSNESGSGSGAEGGGSGSSSAWDQRTYGAYVAGMRMTVIDKNGNIVSGTHTVDFVNFPEIKNNKNVSMNPSSNRFKNKVVSAGGVNWTKHSYSYIQSPPKGVTIKFDSSENLKINGVSQSSYFNNLAKSKALYNNYIVKTGYDRNKYSNYDEHYIIVEPTTMIRFRGKLYYGTATELAWLQGDDGPVFTSTIPKKYLARSTCYPGDFAYAGKKNNGVTLEKENVLNAYVKSDFMSGNNCKATNKNRDLTKKVNGKSNGNGVGIYYAAAMLPNMCDINNPEHFHVVDGSDDQDYKPNDKTATCCEEMINRYGYDYVVNLYPICGACPVETSSSINACGSENSVVLKDEDSFSCLFQGVSGKDASKYDYSARQSVRNKYKVGTIGTKYCEVYCTDDVTAHFPGAYNGPSLAPGGSFIWPSYNEQYKATVETTRTCKIRFRQQEWLNAFNKGNASTKQSLVNALKECASENAITKYYDSYIKSLNPKLELSYNNGSSTIGPKTLKLDTSRSTYSKDCSGCNVSTSGLTTSNVTSRLSSLASQITNKVLTIKTNLRYVLPDGLYQYVDKDTGKPLESYTPKSDVNSDGTTNLTDVIDTGNSKLVISENAKAGKKYDVTINFSKLTPTSGKFDKETGKYTCQYEVSNPTLGPVCDVNEEGHFINADSGPNGEDCCEYFGNKWGFDSEEYKELAAKYPRCNSDWPPKDPDPNNPDSNNPDSSCTYPNDLQSADLVTKQKCCTMLLVDNTISEDDRKTFYEQYCSGDPYCPQDCEDGVCHNSPMTENLRSCMAQGKSYNECKVDNCPGGSILIYRPISLYANEAFPGVQKQNRIWSNNNWYYYSNWAYRGKSKKRDYYVDMFITNNREVKEYAIYDLDPMYTIELDAKTIMSIREHNKKNSYDDFNLKCKDGRQCKSTYIRETLAGKVKGCGVSSDWYACSGISKSRGD